MTVSVLHTADAWWVKTPGGAARIDTAATTTAGLLADSNAIETAFETGAVGAGTVALDSLDLISPVTRPCRVIAQMTNFESHVRDAGMDPASVPLTFFRKASASINGPQAFPTLTLPSSSPDWSSPTMFRRATSNFHRRNSTRPSPIQHSPRSVRSWCY